MRATRLVAGLVVVALVAVLAYLAVGLADTSDDGGSSDVARPSLAPTTARPLAGPPIAEWKRSSRWAHRPSRR